MHNSKYHALLKSKVNIDQEEQGDRKRSAAEFFLKQLGKGSVWFQIENIKTLFLYIEFDFVKKALMNFYKDCTNPKVKKTIKDLHDGSLDLTELKERRSRIEEIRNEFRKSREKHKQEEENSEDYESFNEQRLEKFSGNINVFMRLNSKN